MYYLFLQNIFQSIALNFIQGKLFSHCSRIFFLSQMCYRTFFKHQLNGFDKLSEKTDNYDKHKNNIVTNGWLLFLGNVLSRFLSYSSSRG